MVRGWKLAQSLHIQRIAIQLQRGEVEMKPEYDFSNGKRGAVDPIPDSMTRITLCLDKSVINWFRIRTEMEPGYSPTGDYHERINEILRLRMYKEILALDERKLKGD